MRIAVYGGSFNPPHRVHSSVASWIVSSGAADRVWLVPVFEHAFEGVHQKMLAPFSLRLAWCNVMAQEIGPRVEVSYVESRLASPSYTVDTLNYLSETHPQHQFHLVIGADILSQTEGWKSWAKIGERYAPIIVGREGYADDPQISDGAPTFPAVSSTTVRERLLAGESIEDLVTPAVCHTLLESNPWRN